MRLDFSGAEAFLEYLEGRLPIAQVLEHPAYQSVCQHALRWGGNTITEASVLDGLEGRETPFYGLGTVKDNLQAIHDLKHYIEEKAQEWTYRATQELYRLLPQEDVSDITVYPIIGYDAGIGLQGNVCMSLNCTLYHQSPMEFLSTMVHEAFHVVYERIHGVTGMGDLSTHQSRLDFFLTMLQNEGTAVYAPLAMREQMNYPITDTHPLQKDYALLANPTAMEKTIEEFWHVLNRLDTEEVRQDQFLKLVFGTNRLTYRVGSELLRLIEHAHGLAAVQDSVYLTGPELFEKYGDLLT